MHDSTPTTLEGERMSPRSTMIWLWLTAPIAVLLAIAAGSELLVDGLFRGDEELINVPWLRGTKP